MDNIFKYYSLHLTSWSLSFNCVAFPIKWDLNMRAVAAGKKEKKTTLQESQILDFIAPK